MEAAKWLAANPGIGEVIYNDLDDLGLFQGEQEPGPV